MREWRPRKEGDTARVTKAELEPEPGTCSRCLDLGRASSLASPAPLPLLGPPLWGLPLSSEGLLRSAGFCSNLGDVGAQLPFDLSSDTRPAVCCTLNATCPLSYRSGCQKASPERVVSGRAGSGSGPRSGPAQGWRDFGGFRIRYRRSVSTSVVQLFVFSLFISLVFCEVIFREFQPV